MAETGARYRQGSSPRIAAYAGRRIRPSIEDKQWNVRFWPLPIGPGLPQPRSSSEDLRLLGLPGFRDGDESLDRRSSVFERVREPQSDRSADLQESPL